MNTAAADNATINFSDWTGRGVKVAVNSRGKVIRGVGMALVDRAGHGTACAGIIHRIAPAAELYSVRVFDESLCADGRALLEALHWAIEYGMDVVNLSLGTTDPSLKGPMEALCREALKTTDNTCRCSR